MAEVTREADSEIARQYLEPNPYRSGWLLKGEEVTGRLRVERRTGDG